VIAGHVSVKSVWLQNRFIALRIAEKEFSLLTFKGKLLFVASAGWGASRRLRSLLSSLTASCERCKLLRIKLPESNKRFVITCVIN